MKQNQNNSLFDRTLLRRSLRASFTKLDPRQMVKNPIMFTVEVVTFAMLLLLVWIAVTGDTSQGTLLYNSIVFLVLLLTVLFANFAEAIAEARGKAQADVGVAMNSGTQAAKEAGNMVDLDNDPTKLIEIVEIGKQLLMTRGTLTTFSIANDVAKYFAIVPALFIASIPSLGALNIMHLHSPESAILSAVIFNALIIPLLIPLALRGVTYKPIGASALLRRNLFIYGLGGVVAPFIGIKLIDTLISVFF